MYVIDAGEAGVKIGISVKPKKRAHSIRTSTSHRIDIFKTWGLKNTDAARSVEKAAHKALRQFRLRGEWFSIRPQEAAAVIEHIMAGDERRASMLVTTMRRMKAFAYLGAEDGHSGDADLHAIAKTMGGDFTLANRRARCRVPGCPGRVRFIDMSSAWPRKLDTISDKDDAWWAYFAAERKRLEALGWWMQMGYWQPPPAPVYGPETAKDPPPEGSGPR